MYICIYLAINPSKYPDIYEWQYIVAISGTSRPDGNIKTSPVLSTYKDLLQRVILF